MNNPKISAIAALSEDRVIGKNNKLPWKIPSDTQRFRDMTRGHAVIMGRKTYESIGHPLPDRPNIVVTRQPSFSAPGCTVFHSIEDAVNFAKEIENEEIYIIGGGEIYSAALPYTDRLYLTIVEGKFEGDAYFPEYDEFKRIISEEKHKDNGYNFKYVTLEK